MSSYGCVPLSSQSHSHSVFSCFTNFSGGSETLGFWVFFLVVVYYFVMCSTNIFLSKKVPTTKTIQNVPSGVNITIEG
jgi:uncharacterized membrane protein YhaH (DUF805 family)